MGSWQYELNWSPDLLRINPPQGVGFLIHADEQTIR
jgi:hypothetical protein